MAIDSWKEVEEQIKVAVHQGILIDKREVMPRGKRYKNILAQWRAREVADVMGICIHQSLGRRSKDPMGVAHYHTSPKNHITPGRPLPSLCYQIAIPEEGPAWLCGDFSWITFAQGASDKLYPGDENRHLLALVVLGAFWGLGWKKRWAKPEPSKSQLTLLPKVVQWSMDTFDFGGEGVFGHYHFGKSACPGYVITEFIEACREKDDQANFDSLAQVQEALLCWDPDCLPKQGVTGDMNSETRRALLSFQRNNGLRVTGIQDPFTELLLLQRYHVPLEDVEEVSDEHVT